MYQVDKTDKKVTCYIEAQAGEQFRVLHLNRLDAPSDRPAEDGLAYDVSTYVDGVKVGGVVYGPGSVIYQQPKGVARVQEAKGMQDSEVSSELGVRLSLSFQPPNLPAEYRERTSPSSSVTPTPRTTL